MALLSLALVACGDGSGPGPRTAPANAASLSAAWVPEADVDLTLLQRALDGDSATALRIIGRIASSGAAVPIELTLARSGAMRLQSTDGSGRAVVSNGSRLWVVAEGGATEAEAWSTAIEGAGDLLGVLSPFDLVEALLPTPWPLLDEAPATTSIARTPDGLWLSTFASTPAGPQITRRRALVDPVDGSVLRRERYDPAGNLQITVVGDAGAGGSVTIGRPQEGVELTLQIDTLVRDPELEPDTFVRPR